MAQIPSQGTTVKSVLKQAALAVGLAAGGFAAHADRATTPIFTPILTVNCFGFGVCAPGIPVTQMVETAPGEFVGVMEFGVMYMLSSSGSFSQGYVINDTNTWNSTPLVASDGNLYVPSSAGSADIVEFNVGLTWLANFSTPAYLYAIPLVETPDQVLHGTGAPGFPTAGNDFTLTLDGTVTTLPQTVAVNTLLVSSTGDLYGMTATALLKFASDGSYTTLATFANAVPGFIEASDGNFYGCNGTLFRVTPQGVFTSLPGVPTGHGCVIQASDGLLYGANQDQVYSSTLDGVVSVIYDFNGFDQGQQTSQYVKSIIQGSDGKLYGHTTGELDSNGTIGATIYSLDLGLPKPEPAIVRASARKLAAGATVLITGHNFLGTTSVTIGGRRARFKVRAAEYLEVTAPTHPALGNVVVTTPNGTATSAFKLLVL
jgi:IPT/TIG domain